MRIRAVRGLVFTSVYLALCMVAWWWLVNPKDIPSPSPTATAIPSEKPPAAVKEFCATCHPFPSPNVLPKSAWEREIRKMYTLYAMRTPSTPSNLPAIDAVLNYYLAHAPRSLNVAPLSSEPISSKHLFDLVEGEELPLGEPAAVASLTFDTNTHPRRLLFADWRRGTIESRQPGRPDTTVVVSEVTAVGRMHWQENKTSNSRSLLVASLGSILPTDKRVGKILRVVPEDQDNTRILFENVRRVADTRSSDFDHDGDLDYVVGVFGHYEDGEIVYLDNMGEQSPGKPLLEPYLLEGRPGCTSLHTVDLDGDGLEDIVALLSQHIESVVMYLNAGAPSFVKVPLFEADHPAWGFCAMEPVDLDGDGDCDFVLANGDTLDNEVIKPYHGISWLENRGSLRFVHHPLFPMPGAYCVRTGDFDRDGDSDIVAASWLPLHGPSSIDELAAIDSIVWLEQTTLGEFVKHVLEKGLCVHPALEIGDYDEDGDLDLFVAQFISGCYYREHSRVRYARSPFLVFRNNTFGPHETEK